MTVYNAYLDCKNTLISANIEGADFEALCLINKVTGLDRIGLISHKEDEISTENLELLNSYVNRRLNHEPLQYILESWSFCGFDFTVGKGVLIPRDDTEVAVGLCLDFLKNRESKNAIDLCAGSGAITVALEKLGNANMTSVELKDDAFYFLKKNIFSNNCSATPYKGDIFTCYKDFDDNCFDLIVSNPPYIKSDDISTLQEEVLFEPSTALDGGKSGYDFYEAIIEHWSSKLKHGGALVFELGEDQADYVTYLMNVKGFQNIRTELDFGGIQRAIIGTMLTK